MSSTSSMGKSKCYQNITSFIRIFLGSSNQALKKFLVSTTIGKDNLTINASKNFSNDSKVYQLHLSNSLCQKLVRMSNSNPSIAQFYMDQMMPTKTTTAKIKKCQTPTFWFKYVSKLERPYLKPRSMIMTSKESFSRVRKTFKIM